VAHARGRVVIVHGYGEHRGRYRWLATRLAELGFEPHLFDLRGHGESQGRRGYVDRFADYVIDLDRVVGAVLERAGLADGPGSPSVPVFLFGHSLGGLICLSAILGGLATVAGVAASSPFLGPVGAWAALLRPFIPVLRLVPGLSLPRAIDPDSLTHDRRIVEEHRRDPLVFQSADLWWGRETMLAQEALLEGAPRIGVPVFFQVGGDDRVADVEVARRVFARIGSPDKRFETYEGFFHEVFNETERERPLGDLTGWLARLSPGP
jgi:alpha-beta hydrolase superfamily lysophospholipase